MKRLLTLLLCSSLLFATDAGPASGTPAGSGWTSPANVGASDNVYATYSLPGTSGKVICSAKAVELGCEPSAGVTGISSALYISSLGFAVPAGATVTGITATFEHKCSGASSCSASTAQLTKTAGTGQGTNKGSATAWGTIDSTDTLGSATDLWGSTWTVSEINAAGFGFVVVVLNSNSSTRTASVDYMALTVSYSASGSGSHRRIIISQTRTIQIHG